MAQPPFVLSVKALVRDGQGRYLVLRRSRSSKNNPGLWDFPGGKIDPGETFDGALVREIAEETGLTVQLEHVVGAAESELPDRKVAYLFLEAQLQRGETKISNEHDAFAWLTAVELAEADLCPQFRGFAKAMSMGRLDQA